MKLRPGRNLVRVCAALTAWTCLTFFWIEAAWLIPIVGLACVLSAASDLRFIRREIKHISIVRSNPSTVGRGISFLSCLTVENEGPHELMAELRDVLPADAEPNFWTASCRLPRGQTQVEAEFRIAQRGLHEFGPMWIRLDGPAGLLSGQQRFDVTDSIKVLPERYWSRDELIKDSRAEIQLLDKLSKSRLRGVGTEFESLSEFREGDDPRRIDWRATARHRYPIVRRFQIERHRDLMILIDCGRLMGTDSQQGTKLDCAVDAALLLGRVALEGGDRCGLGIFDDQVLGYLAPQSGAAAMHTLTDCVYNLQSRWRESDFSLMFATLQAKHPKRALVVVVSDIVDSDTSQRFRASLARLAKRHVVVFAALRTPLLRQITHEPIETLRDGSRKAVAFRMLRDRERAIHTLRRSGIQVVDVEPADLAVPLINQFIELRQRNLV